MYRQLKYLILLTVLLNCVTTKIVMDKKMEKRLNEPPVMTQDIPRKSKLNAVIQPEVIEPITGTILFDFDSYEVKNVDNINTLIVGNFHRTAYLIGGACPIGESGYNYTLSCRRSESVAEIIRATGMNVVIECVGEDNLISDEPKKYYLNRRVEIIIK